MTLIKTICCFCGAAAAILAIASGLGYIAVGETPVIARAFEVTGALCLITFGLAVAGVMTMEGDEGAEEDEDE